jgi:outer membrane beta-barrel protein
MNIHFQRSTKDMPMLMTAQPKLPARRFLSRRFLARRLAIVVALAVTAVPLLAQAQRKSPLADAPAIRKRYELRSTRFELGVGAGSTINQDFYHSVLINGRLGFHITDWLSLAVVGGISPTNLSTGFRDKVIGSLGDTPPLAREPTAAVAANSILKINNFFGAQLEATPFAGKYSLFGKLFAAYDTYLFVGPGGLSVAATSTSGLTPCSSHTKAGGTAQASDFQCDDSGTKIGVNMGIGFHSFFNNWLALNVELRDILTQINPAGRDVNGDQIADSHDDTWTNTFMATASLTFYLPTVPNISQ